MLRSALRRLTGSEHAPHSHMIRALAAAFATAAILRIGGPAAAAQPADTLLPVAIILSSRIASASVDTIKICRRQNTRHRFLVAGRSFPD